MSNRIFFTICGVMALAACATAPRPVPTPVTDEAVLARCRAVEKSGPFIQLEDAHQRWVRECARLFSAGNDLRSSKARVRLALDFRADRDLQASVVPVTWGDLAPAVGRDAQALVLAAQDGEALALLARWRMEVLNDQEEALALACKAAQVAPRLFEGQLLCGDYVRRVSLDEAAAARAWVLAYPLAGSRAQQCQVVERITEYGLDPERDEEGMSATVVTACQQRREERRWRLTAVELHDVARELEAAAAAVARAKSPPPPETASAQK